MVIEEKVPCGGTREFGKFCNMQHARLLDASCLGHPAETPGHGIELHQANITAKA